MPWHWKPRPVQRILLPLDGGPLEAGTLQPLVDLVHRCGANVVVAHVRTSAVGFTQGLDRTAIDAARMGIEHS